jgi:hypothetical protein
MGRLPLKASANTMPKKVVVESEAAIVVDEGDKVLVTAHVEKSLIAEIDEFRWSDRIEGRAETVRQLIGV